MFFWFVFPSVLFPPVFWNFPCLHLFSYNNCKQGSCFPWLPGAFSWKCQTVKKTPIFLFYYINFYSFKKGQQLINSKKFRGQPPHRKRPNFCHFWPGKGQPGKPGATAPMPSVQWLCIGCCRLLSASSASWYCWKQGTETNVDLTH